MPSIFRRKHNKNKVILRYSYLPLQGKKEDNRITNDLDESRVQ